MMILAAGVLAGGLYLVPVAAGVSGCVARERLRGTLDPLLSTPLGRQAILRSKVRAHAERGLVFAGGAVAGIGAAFGADGWVPGFVAGLAFGAAVLLVVGVGVWASVRAETPGRAFRLTLPAVALGLLLPVGVAAYSGSDGAPRPVVLFVLVGAGFALLGGLFGWRAGVALERGA
jgi:ABC-type Na+ efflux pump permease subunit